MATDLSKLSDAAMDAVAVDFAQVNTIPIEALSDNEAFLACIEAFEPPDLPVLPDGWTWRAVSHRIPFERVYFDSISVVHNTLWRAEKDS